MLREAGVTEVEHFELRAAQGAEWPQREIGGIERALGHLDLQSTGRGLFIIGRLRGGLGAEPGGQKGRENERYGEQSGSVAHR